MPPVAEIDAVTLAPEDDPETVQGLRDNQHYRGVFGTAMDLARRCRISSMDASRRFRWVFADNRLRAR
jgi:hypothetical protein